MLILKENEVCPYKDICKYNVENINGMFCNGAQENRKCKFVCEYVDNNGNILENNAIRNGNDLNGKMNIILENN